MTELTQKEKPQDNQIKPSLISSYCAFQEGTGLCYDATWKQLQEWGVGIDLYTFMQTDCVHFAKKFLETEHIEEETPQEKFLCKEKWFGYESITCPLFLARLDEKEIAYIAKIVAGFSSQYSVPIVAIASFLPEIASPPDFNLAYIARRAIKALFRLAIEIGKEAKSKPPVVELVAGSRVQRVIEDTGEYNALVTPGEQGQIRVIQAIQDVILELSSQGNLPKGFHVALELEPGPLFILQDTTCLVGFSNKIQENKALEDILGFNLDISHWYMAGIEPKDIPDSVKSRIYHAHISGHSRQGHLGDFSLQRSNAQEKDCYKEWIDFLKNLSEKLSWSGYISLEYEVAKDSTSVEESINCLKSWL